MTPNPVVNATSAQRVETILLIDDDENLRDMVGLLLERVGVPGHRGT